MEKYNSYAEQGAFIQIPVCDKVITQELSGDFTLPDYQPEIKRLLRITASVLPASGYFGTSDAEFSGNIDYYVLYTGSDNEVYCAPLTAEYSVSVPIDCDDMGAGFEGSAHIVSDSVSGRVVAPRKLSIRCRLKTNAHIYSIVPLGGDFGSDVDPAAVEKLNGEVNAARIYRATGEIMRLNDEIIPDSRSADIRVICAEGKVMINEVNSNAGEVNCRGDVHMKVMMSKENGSEPYSVVRKMPFSQNIPIEGVSFDCNAYASGTVSELSVSVEEGRISIDAGVIIQAEAQKNENIGYVKDMYSTVCDTECEYRQLGVPVAKGSFNGNFTLSDSLSLEEAGINPASGIVDCTGTAYVEDCAHEKGKCVISGKGKFSLILERDNEYSTNEIEFPFKYELDCPEGTVGTDCRADVISCRARLDGERIGIDAEIAICGRNFGIENISALTAVHFGEQLKGSCGEYVICFPAKDDTLWSVAQRYRTHISSLIDANQLSDNCSPDAPASLEGINYLII